MRIPSLAIVELPETELLEKGSKTIEGRALKDVTGLLLYPASHLVMLSVEELCRRALVDEGTSRDHLCAIRIGSETTWPKQNDFTSRTHDDRALRNLTGKYGSEPRQQNWNVTSVSALLLSVVSAAPTSDTQRPATEAITTATDSADYSYRRITLDPVSATTGAWGVTSPVKLLIYPTLMTENFSGPGETAVGRALNMRSLLCFQEQNLFVVGTKDECFLYILLSLKHQRLTHKVINEQAYLKATENMGKDVIRLANTLTIDYILRTPPRLTTQSLGPGGLTSTIYRQAASAKPSVQLAGQAHDHSRTPPGDHKEQRKSSNVPGNDPSARSSWPRSEKWVASRSKSRSRSREPLSAQKHTEHDRIYTAPSPALM
ncbi:hypothetical protein HPB51_008668 [Rhipicephalus microplus]|uniref:Uncharacterized protein n=1 Tax=Rhipicephalus microplus TaxID=6941 RepID=A0A9J6E8G7_RHIMP|nr:hypothetical protein HPB51_008668 [Rhipicephalus microplus]